MCLLFADNTRQFYFRPELSERDFPPSSNADFIPSPPPPCDDSNHVLLCRFSINNDCSSCFSNAKGTAVETCVSVNAKYISELIIFDLKNLLLFVSGPLSIGIIITTHKRAYSLTLIRFHER